MAKLNIFFVAVMMMAVATKCISASIPTESIDFYLPGFTIDPFVHLWVSNDEILLNEVSKRGDIPKSNLILLNSVKKDKLILAKDIKSIDWDKEIITEKILIKNNDNSRIVFKYKDQHLEFLEKVPETNKEDIFPDNVPKHIAATPLDQPKDGYLVPDKTSVQDKNTPFSIMKTLLIKNNKIIPLDIDYGEIFPDPPYLLYRKAYQLNIGVFDGSIDRIALLNDDGSLEAIKISTQFAENNLYRLSNAAVMKNGIVYSKWLPGDSGFYIQRGGKIARLKDTNGKFNDIDAIGSEIVSPDGCKLAFTYRKSKGFIFKDFDNYNNYFGLINLCKDENK